MKRAVIFLLFFIFCLPDIFGQINDWIPGYILPNDGDTIYGYIRERNDGANTRSCHFKKFSDDEFKEYTPKEVREYKLNGGKYYVSKEFKLDEREMQLYVEFLVNGVVNLYYFRMPDKERYLLEKKGEPLTVIEGEVIDTIDLTTDERLDQQATYLQSGSKTHAMFATSLKSQGQIIYFLKEDPAIQQKVKNLHYDQRSMINLTRHYHNKVCDDYECIVYNKNTSLSKKYIGIYAGVNIGSLVFKSDNRHSSNLVDADITRKLKPVIGLNYSSTIPYVNRNMCIDLYVSYSEHHFEYYFNGTSEEITEYGYKQGAITGLLGYYVISQEKFKMNPSIGLSGIVMFGGANDRERISGHDFGAYKALPTDTKILISLNSGMHASYMIREKYDLKMSILYEFIRDPDELNVTSNSHVFYFMFGINRLLSGSENK